jgi:chromosome segregation ATPase
LQFSGNDFNESNTNWSWDVSGTAKSKTDEIIADLNKTIDELRKEKQELISSLELLDSDHQVNTEKLVNIKEKLQNDYNGLEDSYNKLREENEALLETKKKSKKELQDLKARYQTLEKSSARDDKTSADGICFKCEKLVKENQKNASEVEKLIDEIAILKSNNVTLRKTFDDSKITNDEEFTKLDEKLKLCESENKILVSELQKATQSIATFEKKSEIDAENCKKLALILEGYEQQVSCLKQELLVAKNTEDFVKLRNDYDEIHKLLQKTVSEKEQAHMKYVNILTENMKKYVDCDKPLEEVRSFQDSTNEDDPHVSEFRHQVESILNILLDLKSKCESLEKELYNVTQERTNLLTEKNHEIEKLLQNSEILSQEVITKSQTIKDYENECNELIKNNDMLISELEIFKNNSGLQTISESNEDNLLLLESQLENANKKIQELENIISQLENNVVKSSSEETAENYVSKISHQKLLDEVDRLTKENFSLKVEIENFEHSNALINDEKKKLGLTLEKMKTDLENMEYQYTEININMDALKDEVENQRKKIQELIEQKLCLKKLNGECERNNENVRSELNIVREKLLLEEDARRQVESQIRNLTEKLQNAKMCETSLKLQYDTVSKELVGVNDAKFAIETSLKKSLVDLAICQENFIKLGEENEALKNTVVNLETKLKNEKQNPTQETKQLDMIEPQCEQQSFQYIQTNKENQKSNKEEEEIVASSDQFESITFYEDSYIKQLKEENHNLLTNLNELKLMYDSVVTERNNLQTEVSKLTVVSKAHSTCSENIKILEKNIEELNTAKSELTNVIITKHQENVTYHNEIQRLSQILNVEAEKGRDLESQLQAMKITPVDSTDLQKMNDEIDKLTDQNNFLRQKCEVLAENLLQEQNKIQQILAEHTSPTEREQTLSKKLERLQSHLIEVEEHYTQELLKSEEKNSELRAKINEIEQREKNSSTMYTSVSIRANQHVETLQHQLQLITNQRDELRKKISDAEDHSNKQEAALANLQFVLEQFQKDKEKHVQKETERIRRQITVEKRIQEDLKKEMASLQLQLEESKHGLQAASRISDQLEQSKQLSSSLKGEGKFFVICVFFLEVNS